MNSEATVKNLYGIVCRKNRRKLKPTINEINENRNVTVLINIDLEFHINKICGFIYETYYEKENCF